MASGYLQVDYDGCGLIVIQKDDSANIFRYDDEAAEAFVRDGGKIITQPCRLNVIPVDTPNNRKMILRGTFHLGYMNEFGEEKYVSRIYSNGAGVTTTDDFTKSTKLKFKDVRLYVEKFIRATGIENYFILFEPA